MAVIGLIMEFLVNKHVIIYYKHVKDQISPKQKHILSLKEAHIFISIKDQISPKIKHEAKPEYFITMKLINMSRVKNSQN